MLKNTRLYFWAFILIHTLLWTLGPSLLRPTVSHDALESITWGLQWQLGYNKHPFLTAWLSAGITQLFGVVGWPIYFLAQLAILTTFWASWRLANSFLSPAHALVATLSLEGILFYNINSFNLTPDTLQSPLWALLALVFYRALCTQKIQYWLYTGLIAALCLCTKYQIVLLLLPMFLLCLFDPFARKSFKKPGIYYGIAAFVLLIAPHLIWLANNHFISLTYAIHIPDEYTPNKTHLDHITYPLRFLFNNLANVAGLFILFWPFYNKHKVSLELSSFQWKYLIYLGLGPATISMVLCIITGDYFAPRWATPYYFSLGILVMAYLKPELTKTNLKQFAITLLVVSSLLFAVRTISMSFYFRPSSDAYLPNKQIAQVLSKIWQEKYTSPLPFLAGSNYLVTGVTPYMPNQPKPYLNWNQSNNPWINETELRQKGGLFIWDAGFNYTWDKDSYNHSQLTPSVLKRFPTLQQLPMFTFYRASNNQAVLIGVAILPPST